MFATRLSHAFISKTRLSERENLEMRTRISSQPTRVGLVSCLLKELKLNSMEGTFRKHDNRACYTQSFNY